MHNTQSGAKSKLEISKKRLADAFRKLEAVLGEKLTIQAHNNYNLQENYKLQEKVRGIEAENTKLVVAMEQLKRECSGMRTLNTEALEELNNSITMIESILKR